MDRIEPDERSQLSDHALAWPFDLSMHVEASLLGLRGNREQKHTRMEEMSSFTR